MNDKHFKKLERKTLCINCKTPSPLCPWKYDLTPVPGWDAIPSDVKISTGNVFHGYVVVSCPLFTENTREPSWDPLAGIRKGARKDGKRSGYRRRRIAK